MKVALAQINPTVGDVEGNLERILADIERARASRAQLVVFPELAVFGYPPKDLVLRHDLVDRNLEALDRIASQCRDINAVVGCVLRDTNSPGPGLVNAAAFCGEGHVVETYAKVLLPTYDVFDERRYFTPGRRVSTVVVRLGNRVMRVGLSVCEDLWNDRQFEGRRIYGTDPIAHTAHAGADLLVNVSASPYRAGIQKSREALFAQQIREHRIPLVCVNQIGGNDDLLFDGASLVLDAKGEIIARAKAFEEDFLVVELDQPDNARIEPYPDRTDSIRQGLVLGIRDYVHKCGFESAVIGLSGGIDSAVTAALAVESLGPQRVQCVALPSRYSSGESIDDARTLAENLGVAFLVMPVEKVHNALEEAVATQFARAPSSAGTVAEENMQARIRGAILMALSNKFGSLLLTTGNKSELAVGYCTLYGDMCGGLAVLSDVPKTTVYELARRINGAAGRSVIPERTLTKAPSAELKANQTDQDSLPPYEVLDAILEHYVEYERSVDDIVSRGFDRTTVEWVSHMVDRSEFKRKQAAVGLKVTSRAFGSGRRMPIAARFR